MNVSFGQDTLRVIYHDFQSAHPDFGGENEPAQNQNRCTAGLNSQMVQAILPANKIPLISTNPIPSPNTASERQECLDLNIASWFPPLTTPPAPGFPKTFPGFLLDQGLPNDGLFTFDSQSFFPLDTVSGAEIFANGHNYLFCLEVHEKFTYVGGEVFNFRGDDDVWLFINNRLALDIGGIHGATSGNLNMDASAAALGITRGNTYDFDFYFCERQVVQSSIRITTNIPIASSKVSKPTADPAGRSFDSQLSVLLSTQTPGATIFYTTDGSTPDSLNTATTKKYTSAILITTNTTIKAIAYRSGWQASDMMTEVYGKNSSRPVLDILDELGNPFQYGFITEKNTAYTVKITTTQAGLTTLNPVATTKVGLDREVLNIGNRQTPGDYFVFSGKTPFSLTTTVAANGTTEAKLYDSLTVRWANPVDSINEVAVKKIEIRPAPKQAVAYFSTSPTGSPATDQFVGTETVIYLFVIDQVLRPGLVPEVVLVTTPTNGIGRVVDRDTLSLAATATPGLYSVAIPVKITSVSKAGNDTLELQLEDLISGTYKDPMDVEAPAVANAGYGTTPEIEASLQFTDKDHNVWPAITYSPAKDSLFLTYKDDWVTGQILTKTANLTIVNLRNAASDTETVVLKLDSAQRQGSTAVWQGAISLKDGPLVTKRNGIAESYILGEAKAVVATHTKSGSALGSVTDNISIAYDDEDPDIDIVGPKGPGVKIVRTDTELLVTIDDQSISSAQDTIYATLSCTESKDIVANLMLIEKAGSPGQYESFLISKSEGAVIADGILQCKSKDFAKISYEDVVSKVVKEVIVIIDSPVSARLFFSSTPDGKTEITSISDLTEDFFYVVVAGRSPTLDNADVISGVILTTPQSEKETFDLVETGPYTELFVAKVPFAFIGGAPAQENKTVEGVLTQGQLSDFVVATGKGTVDGFAVQGSINLIAAFAPVDRAYIKDANGDGKADHVYIVFKTKLARLPGPALSVLAQWNSADKDGVPAPSISFLNGDSDVVVLDYSSKQFPEGLTSIAVGQVPVATLPNDALFRNQKQAIDDSIGPIIITAKKVPATANTKVANDPNFTMDTLLITLSEPVTVGTGTLRKMLKFSQDCGDYDEATVLEAASNPVLSTDPKYPPNTYIVIIDNAETTPPVVKQCIYLNSDPGQVTDLKGNLPPERGVPLSGDDGKPGIKLLRGYPAVAGLDTDNPNFQIATQDIRGDKGVAKLVDGKWQVVWVPPADFTSIGTYDPYDVSNLKEVPQQVRDPSTPIELPPGISALQVVTAAGTAYRAHITLFDNHGNFVKSWTQAFGWRGEMQNRARFVNGGIASYLVWDMRDKNGQLAGQGVYVWKVRFEFQNGRQEIQYTRTGLMR